MEEGSPERKMLVIMSEFLEALKDDGYKDDLEVLSQIHDDIAGELENVK